jgi:hypothetical protein
MENTFHGKRVALVGDSTLWYFTKWLNVVLRWNPSDERLSSQLSNFSSPTKEQPLKNNRSGTNRCPEFTPVPLLLDAANDHFNKRQKYCFPASAAPDVYGGIQPPKISLRNGETQAQWMGFAGSYGGISGVELREHLHQGLANLQPHVVVFNLGLHILHLAGEARDPTAEIVRLWIHYEKYLQAAINASAGVWAKLLLFKTTNFICIEKYNGLFMTASHRYNAHNTTTLKNCQRIVQGILDADHKARSLPLLDYNSTNATESFQDVAAFCRHGSFNENGVLHLNQRLRAFLTKGAQIPPHLDVGLFNDHDMQSCPYTAAKDGRHYHNLNLARIRLMANHLQCYLDQEPTGRS